jgi:hypothetical protein
VGPNGCNGCRNGHRHSGLTGESELRDRVHEWELDEPRGRWSLTSGLAGNGKVRSGSWATSKVCCKATVTALTIISVAQSSCMPRAGGMPDEKFFDAVKLNPKDTTSIQIVAQMDELFGIDAQARQEGLSPIDRHVVRLQKSKPLLEQIKAAIQSTRTGALPKSAQAKACDYTLTFWSRLNRFLEYPELELSNNLAKNAMRPVALGRRNWIHLGSKEAGPRVAAIISIVETCRRLSLSLRDYLGSCSQAWPIFRSIESLNSRPALGRPGSNRRNPAARSNRVCLTLTTFNSQGSSFSRI